MIIFINKGDLPDLDLGEFVDGKYGTFRVVCVFLLLIGLIVYGVLTMWLKIFCLGWFFIFLGVMCVLMFLSVFFE